MDTLLINFFGGPCAGKTTCAMEMAVELKKRGIDVEYVDEFAKHFVWEDTGKLSLDGSLKSQFWMMDCQNKMIQRIYGKTQIIVTDGPILLYPAYAKEERKWITGTALEYHKKYKNVNFFVKRGKTFNQNGRIHNLQESEKKDEEILEMLRNNNISIQMLQHDRIIEFVDYIENKIRRGK